WRVYWITACRGWSRALWADARRPPHYWRRPSPRPAGPTVGSAIRARRRSRTSSRARLEDEHRGVERYISFDGWGRARAAAWGQLVAGEVCRAVSLIPGLVFLRLEVSDIQFPVQLEQLHHVDHEGGPTAPEPEGDLGMHRKHVLHADLDS